MLTLKTAFSLVRSSRHFLLDLCDAGSQNLNSNIDINIMHYLKPKEESNCYGMYNIQPVFEAHIFLS